MASKHYHFKFNFDSDKEIISRIEEQENKNDYIRSLILSDIAADILRSSIKLEDKKVCQMDCPSCPPDLKYQCNHSDDPLPHPDHKMYYHERVNWFNEHCPAVGDPDYDCTGCYYFKHHKDDPFSDAGYCDAPSYFERDMEDIREYFKAGGAMRDYPAEFKGLKKDDSNASNALNVVDEEVGSDESR